MKKHFIIISLGLMNLLHGLFHIIQFIQSLFFVAYASSEHKSEGLIETIMHSPIFALIMGTIGVLTLVIGIKDYRHHKKCHKNTELNNSINKDLDFLELVDVMKSQMFDLGIKKDSILIAAIDMKLEKIKNNS